MNSKANTADHNIDVLLRRGFHKEGNTSIFRNGSNSILSPGVSEGTTGRYWFDVREVNLKRVDPDSFLLVRIVPDLFILENLKSLSTLFSPEVMDNRPHSGNVWGIHIEMEKSRNKARFFNTKNSNKKISTDLLGKTQLTGRFDEIGV